MEKLSIKENQDYNWVCRFRLSFFDFGTKKCEQLKLSKDSSFYFIFPAFKLAKAKNNFHFFCFDCSSTFKQKFFRITDTTSFDGRFLLSRSCCAIFFLRRSLRLKINALFSKHKKNIAAQNVYGCNKKLV